MQAPLAVETRPLPTGNVHVLTMNRIEECVDRSHGRIRADVVFDRLVAMGYQGSVRMVRRAVAEAKKAWRHGQRRVFRPWIPEPGMWALDRAMRIWDGCPTYWLTDNERTVTTGHVARIAIRNPQIVAVAAPYGVTIATCVPADRQSKGGSEATVRIAKADLVPTDCNCSMTTPAGGELSVAVHRLAGQPGSTIIRPVACPSTGQGLDWDEFVTLLQR